MSKLRRIFIPEDLTVKMMAQYKLDGEPLTRRVTFFTFLEDNIFSDGAKIGKKATEVRKALKALDEFEQAQKRADAKFKQSGAWPTDVYVDLTEEMWGQLNSICDEPSGGWSPFYFKQFLRFIDAIMSAQPAPEPPPTDAKDITPTPPA